MIRYKTVQKGASTTDRAAFKDYREWVEDRGPEGVKTFFDFRRINRKIWKKVFEASIDYESGVYDKKFFYLVPQVIDNLPFVQLSNGKIKTNSHTGGDIYSPIFCNLLPDLKHYCWTIDGTYTDSYSSYFAEKINKCVPKYYFILPTLIKNKL